MSARLPNASLPGVTPTEQAPGGPTNGRRFASALIGLMNTMLGVIEQETALIRAGRLSEAATLGDQKSALAGQYLTDTLTLKKHAPVWFADDPEALAVLQQRHELFRALLQVNLTVLATAHAVSEGLIRGAAGELARKNAPQGYGANGYAMKQRAGAAPVAISRTL
jgi:hypothetical protein